MEFLITAAVFVACELVHGYHCRRSRRRGPGIWVSMRGPSGTRIGRRF
jgi:hypothetical protein